MGFKTMTRMQIHCSSNSGYRQNDPSVTKVLVSVRHRTRKRASPDNVDEQQQLCPQQRYVKRPKHPGMATFDGTLRELPLQRHKLDHQVLPTDVNLDRSIAIDSPIDKTYPLIENQVTVSFKQFCRALPRRHNNSGSQPEVTPLATEHSQKVLAVDNLSIAPFRHSLGASNDSIPGQPNPEVTASFCNSGPHGLQPSGLDLPLLMPLLEAKLIYADLAASEIELEPTTAPSGSESPHSKAVWKALGGLRQALLQNSHDFFAIYQDPEAPLGLKRLAVKFGVSAEHTKLVVKRFVSYFQEELESYLEQLIVFVGEARTTLDWLAHTFPTLATDWMQINEDIHRFLHALQNEGMIDHCMYGCQLSVEPAKRNAWSSFMESTPNALDGQLREWYFRHYPTPPTVSANRIAELYALTGLPLKGVVLCLVSGWLCFGPRIAETFHNFCKVFKFLSWFGATF